MDIGTSTTTSSHALDSRERMIPNSLLIWLDENIDQSTETCQNMLASFQSVVDSVNIFTNPHDCVEFLSKVDDMEVFVIIEGTLGLQIVPLIHNLPQVRGIFIFCSNISWDGHWVKAWN